YTLAPAPLGRDAMDDFLFDTREGFCEHYSSAFTVLMRAAGIPARVVTGYQGGYWNALGGYLLVRNSDAHAGRCGWLATAGYGSTPPPRCARSASAWVPPPRPASCRGTRAAGCSRCATAGTSSTAGGTWALTASMHCASAGC